MVKDNRLTPFTDRVITNSEVTDEIKENCLTPFDDQVITNAASWLPECKIRKETGTGYVRLETW